ncbi:hypothetical protein GCM10027289_04690 [Tsukamurella serpentis]
MTDRHTGAALSRRGFARLGASTAVALVAATATAGIATAAPDTDESTTTEKKPVAAAPPVATKTGWVALADDATKQITVWHNGEVVRTMPTSMGSNKHPTPNGVYYTMEKKRDMYMDSSTYGVPVNSPDGYRTYVEYATRMSWSGIFVHAAPWSVNQQGVSNVSHGCLNVSTANGKYIYDNFPIGTPIVVRGTVGGNYTPGS